ncbi:DUF3515 family protein [Corynebacterium macginleyi]|uniref:DUF3515 domain-containing protein n=1 Tax=Corynebacterium macginleyi TaxID=38290 RepID=A0ABS1Y6W2_9CORY|nr:DUF3515 domain-containing protein [Corynebacterium macginleyi]MBK4139505.1 DUF3515 family protein [Corynebacterium macginleyi]MBK4148788.1 DUF3515 family protein [Corynebacterium macginleyi]MBK4152199.1 DUF3515 family protein [Corynebacterium macginleyi]MBK4160046.1 DUF3515 family protein [Corynebacterium macginleyi]MBK4175067.1 DUF3515 family protein [Corynebacterium macginleyi]
MTSQFNRTMIFISLGLSIVMVLAVLFGAKYVFTNTAKAPVAVSPVDSEEADSQACRDFVNALPDQAMGQPRADIAEPVPAGVAAWAANSQDKVTARCGVAMPFQYTDYSTTQDINGERWFQVKDATSGSNLTTWYTAQRFPIVAVTTFNDEGPEDLNEAVATLKDKPAKTHLPPLRDIKPSKNDRCAAVEKALPEEIADGYHRRNIDAKDTYVWSLEGHEDIVVRCGVARPENYKAGVQLQQVNDIAWFEDTTLAQGTTAGTWFALGRENYLALHAPQDSAQSALVALSDIIAKHIPER